VIRNFGLWLLVLAGMSFAAAGSDTPPHNLPATYRAPSAKTPAALVEFWLRFHETELCQDLDSVLSFHGSSLEMWCVAGDEKSFRKLQQMAAPLHSAGEITIYPTRPPAGKKKPDEKAPPPSLWNNEELLGAVQNIAVWSLPAGSSPLSAGAGGPGEVVKQRLIMYADRLLEWSGKIKRYGPEIPELARLGVEPGLSPAQRKRSLTLCLAHAQAIDKNAARLVENITPAIPKSNRRADIADKAAKAPIPDSYVEIADGIANLSAATARGVRDFLYPREHTVEVGDLRDPELLESLRTLRDWISRLQKTATQKLR
jgi:hypothetical protein